MKKRNHVYIEGIDEVVDFLEKELPDKAHLLIRNATHAIAGEVAKEVRKNIRAAGLIGDGDAWKPKDHKGVTLIKSIKTRRRRVIKGLRPYSDVVGAFWWLFHEHGAQGERTSVPETPILRPAIDKVTANMDKILEEQVIKKIQQMTKRLHKKRTGS